MTMRISHGSSWAIIGVVHDGSPMIYHLPLLNQTDIKIDVASVDVTSAGSMFRQYVPAGYTEIRVTLEANKMDCLAGSTFAEILHTLGSRWSPDRENLPRSKDGWLIRRRP